MRDATRNRRRIAVVGADVIGLNVAGRPGAGTTSTSFAWVNASSKVTHARTTSG